MSQAEYRNNAVPQQAKQTSNKLIRTCSIWRALEVVGDTATLLILETIWWGDRRFDLITARTGLRKALVSDRLKKLVKADILKRHQYVEHPPRFEYVLTEKGRGLFTTALMLLRWELRWSQLRHDLPVNMSHKSCGEEMRPEPLCSHCKQAVQASDVTWEEGPGVGWMSPIYSQRRKPRNRLVNPEGGPFLFIEAAELMGDRWSGLILRSIFTQIRKYDEILKDTAIASNILSERLNWLVETGIIKYVVYQDNPPRHEYHLTRKGLDYYPVLLMLQQWGDTYYASPEGPPIILFHKTCGHELRPYVGCSACLDPLQPNAMDVEFEHS